MLRRSLVPAAAVWVALALAGTWCAAAPGALARNPVYRKMLANERGLRSSITEISVQTKLRGFPPLSLTFHGTAYFEVPDHHTVVFDNVPGPLRRLVEDSPSIAPVARWPADYDITITPGAGTTVFHLVPKSSDDPLAYAVRRDRRRSHRPRERLRFRQRERLGSDDPANLRSHRRIRAGRRANRQRARQGLSRRRYDDLQQLPNQHRNSRRSLFAMTALRAAEVTASRD